MKKQQHFKIVSIISFAIILAFTFTACGEDSDEVVGFVWIPAGTFIMGSPDGSTNPSGTTPDAEPSHSSYETQHQVTISKGFYMSKYAITQGQYFALIEFNPSYSTSDGKGRLPVERISWYDAIEFCNKLSEKYGLEQVYTITNIVRDANGRITSADDVDWNKNANGYRLPTEAEWEYACRGAYPNKATEYNTKPFAVGDGTKMTYELANFDARTSYDLNVGGTYSDSSAVYLNKTTEVGSYGANNYGLYDIHGNVREWCWDRYGAYPITSPIDYDGHDSNINRVMRGGSWSDSGPSLRSAYRSNMPPANPNSGVGFRVVRP